MTQCFADLPLQGCDLQRLWCCHERFLWMSFMGVLDDETHGNHILDSTLQFNRCARTRVELDVDRWRLPVVRHISEQAIDCDAVVPGGRSRNTSYDPVLHRYCIELDHGMIEIIANDFVFSVVRRRLAPKEEEGRYVIYSHRRS